MWTSPPTPSRRPRSPYPCSRVDCRAWPVVTFRQRATQLLLAYCPGHADARAADPDYEIASLAAGWVCCLACGRTVPRDMAAEHFAPDGTPCARHATTGEAAIIGL
jgi:hypothetical protein